MIALRLLIHLPAAIARDVWQWVTYDPAARWAQITGDDD